MSTRLHKIDRS
uniref:Uncharacterized protein n=1 Tax=Arundo donax TaxID=35708 RepID=A0A0A9GS64_ARUDO